MATLDFTPLFRSTVGFDRVPSLLSHALQREEVGYLPEIVGSLSLALARPQSEHWQRCFPIFDLLV